MVMGNGNARGTLIQEKHSEVKKNLSQKWTWLSVFTNCEDSRNLNSQLFLFALCVIFFDYGNVA
jgi:hypothetical protein